MPTHDETSASRLHRFAHFCLLAIKSFLRNKCPLRATALAYTTLLALVPLLAVGVSITSTLLKGQSKERTEQMIVQFIGTIAPQLELIQKNEQGAKVDGRLEVARWINDKVEMISTKSLGIGGMLGLVVAAILLLANIETTFNDIWGVTQGRNWFQRVVLYWATISLVPVVVVLAGALQSGPHFESTRALLEKLPVFVKYLFHALPFVIVSLAFTLFYKLMPNTQVTWSAAFIGALVAGGLWALNNLFNALNFSRVQSMSEIYSNLGIVLVLMFLIGIYFSWLILLFGAQVAYAVQNRAVYLQERIAESVHQRGREFVALRLMTRVARHFARGEPPPTIPQLAAALAVPSRLISQILQALLLRDLLVEVVQGKRREAAFAPARPLDQITAHDILMALRAGQGQELATRDEPERARVRGEFEKIYEAERNAAAITLEQMTAEPAK